MTLPRAPIAPKDSLDWNEKLQNVPQLAQMLMVSRIASPPSFSELINFTGPA